MTIAKKDFKNIYETGVKELTDIEVQSVKEAKDLKDHHSKKQKQTAQDSLDHLEKKSGLLQVELKQSINESLRKLQDTLAVENAQSEAFLDSLMVELKTLTSQMKVKLNALKQSHHENVDFARTVAAENYLNNTEQMSFALEQALSNSLQNLRAKAKGNFESLDSNLDKTLTEVQMGMTDLTNSSLGTLKGQANTISDHSSTLLKTLFIDSQNKLNHLDNAARKASTEVDSQAAVLLENIADHASSIEEDINSTYENITTSHFKNADNRLSHFADELSALHDSTTEQLITVTDELADDLLGRSKQVQEGLRNRCDDVVNRVDSLFGTFQEKLNERLQFSRGQKRSLESDKNRILIAVQNELLSIQKSFAKKIAGMLDQSKLELTDMTKGIEAQMLTATASLSDQMNDSAKTIQQEIENEVSRFLQELSKVRSAALDEISTAAQGNIALPKSADYEKNDKDELSDEVKFNDYTMADSQLERDILASAETLTVIDAPVDDLMSESDQLSSVDNSLLEEDLPLQDETESHQALDNLQSGAGENKTRRSRKRKDNKE